MPATRSRAHKRSFVEHHHHHQHTPSTTSQEINSDDESQIIGSNSSRIINHHGEHSNNNIDNNNNDTSLPSSPRLQPVRKHRRIIRHSTSNVAAVPVASSSSSTSIPRVAIPSPFILPPQLPNTNSNNNNNTEDVILIEDDADEFRRHGRNQDDAIVLNSDDEQDDVQVVGSNNVESDSYDEDYDDDDDGVESLSDEDIPVHSSMFSHFLQFRNPLLVIPQFRFNGYLMNALQRIRNTPPEPPRNQADIKKVKYNPPDGSEPAECTICLEKLKKNVMAYKTGCDHMFHIKCLDGWLKSTTRPSCPNCRADLHK